MNARLLEFWLKKSLEKSQKRERRVLNPGDVKNILLYEMCECARHASDNYFIVTQVNTRYIDHPENWYSFEPGIFELRQFAQIIDPNVFGVIADPVRKNDYYFKTLAVSLMKKFYDENPLIPVV
jgi:hypothetical protein